MEPTVKKEDGRYAISMRQVMAACKKVGSNKGAGGLDGMSWEGFDKDWQSLLYKLWNRMTSGRYFPQATREVIIPKAGGGERRLGIPILLDLIAQQVADVIVHCDSLKEAEQLLEKIRERMEECGLTLHREKTKIVRCQKWGSDEKHPNKSFDFLGYRFKPRKASTKEGRLIGTFSPGIGSKAVKRIQTWIRAQRLFRDTGKKLVEISYQIELQRRGWINYYSKFRPSDLRKVFKPVNWQIAKWYAKKHKCEWTEASEKVHQIADKHKYLFKHWQKGVHIFLKLKDWKEPYDGRLSSTLL